MQLPGGRAGQSLGVVGGDTEKRALSPHGPSSTEASFKKGLRKNPVPPKLHPAPPRSRHDGAAEEGSMHPRTAALSLLPLCGARDLGLGKVHGDEQRGGIKGVVELGQRAKKPRNRSV